MSNHSQLQNRNILKPVQLMRHSILIIFYGNCKGCGKYGHRKSECPNEGKQMGEVGNQAAEKEDDVNLGGMDLGWGPVTT